MFTTLSSAERALQKQERAEIDKTIRKQFPRILSKAEIVKRFHGHDISVREAKDWNSKALRRGANIPPPFDQWSKLQLPYRNPEISNIPTAAEIDLELEKSTLYRADVKPCNYVCKIGEKFVCKRSGGRTLLQEAENMIFLAEHTRVRVAKVYAVFIDHVDKAAHEQAIYLVSEFIPGVTLFSEYVAVMSAESKKLLCASIADQFRLLRSVPSPDGSFGRIFHQGIEPYASFLRGHYKEMSGPFDTYDELVSAMYDTMEMDMVISPLPITEEWTSIPDVEFMSEFKPILSSIQDRRPVLTHLDLKWDNMIAEPIKDSRGEIIDWKVTLIDWDMLLWLPVWAQQTSLKDRMCSVAYPDARGKKFKDYRDYFKNPVPVFTEEAKQTLLAGLGDTEPYSKVVSFLFGWDNTPGKNIWEFF